MDIEVYETFRQNLYLSLKEKIKGRIYVTYFPYNDTIYINIRNKEVDYKYTVHEVTNLLHIGNQMDSVVTDVLKMYKKVLQNIFFIKEEKKYE